MSGARDLRRERALAIAAEVRRRRAVPLDDLLDEFERRDYHPAQVVVALARAVDDHLVTVEANRTVKVW